MKTIETRIAEAEAALAAGFTSETARKDAMTYLVGRIYEELTRILPYDTTPYQLSNWREAHASALRANFTSQVEIIERLVKLRAAMKAAPLIAKPKSATAIKNEAKLALAKTCQICGRDIFAETGLIAHHGYTRPGHGYQTGSCVGARELPFEVSRDLLGKHLVAIAGRIAHLKKWRTKTAREECPIHLQYARRVRGARDETVVIQITRENYAELKAEHSSYFLGAFTRSGGTFDIELANELRRQDFEIKNEQNYLKFQQGRFDRWTPKP